MLMALRTTWEATASHSCAAKAEALAPPSAAAAAAAASAAIVTLASQSRRRCTRADVRWPEAAAGVALALAAEGAADAHPPGSSGVIEGEGDGMGSNVGKGGGATGAGSVLAPAAPLASGLGWLLLGRDPGPLPRVDAPARPKAAAASAAASVAPPQTGKLASGAAPVPATATLSHAGAKPLGWGVKTCHAWMPAGSIPTEAVGTVTATLLPPVETTVELTGHALLTFNDCVATNAYRGEPCPAGPTSSPLLAEPLAA